MLGKYLSAAENGETLWIGELREAFSKAPQCTKVVLRLTGCEGTVRDNTLWVPNWENDSERAFVLEYVSACVFNLLSCFGGRELRFCLPENASELAALLEELNGVFGIKDTVHGGYGKVISISNRLNRAFGAGAFQFVIDRSASCLPNEYRSEGSFGDLGQKLRALTKQASDKLCCGIDVGGTDIKAAVSLDGKLLFTKEYDWDPASCSTAEEIKEPILLIARLLRLGAVCPREEALVSAMSRGAGLPQIREAVGALEEKYCRSLRPFDSVGLSFPDVVIHNRILGGETPKTGGLRRNPLLDYEEEFAKLDILRDDLDVLGTPECRVRIANDGGVAAFTAAVEMAEKGESIPDGVFAHSLGTDLGTGWLDETGELPPLPLEMYDFLIDLGSRPQRAYPPEDVRSVRNENSGLPDARKYLGQSAAFRLAEEEAPDLLREYLTEEDGILKVCGFPADMRKACLEHLMQRAEEGDVRARSVFRQIGRDLGQISREICDLLHPATNKRYLYGRFVKRPGCFSLLREGFHEVMPQLELIAADEELAFSPLMRQLAASRETTVAQFGQAIGAIYFGLS